jgi:hypothetical protein
MKLFINIYTQKYLQLNLRSFLKLNDDKHRVINFEIFSHSFFHFTKLYLDAF